MTDFPRARSNHDLAEPQHSGGLRLRLWLACLGGALVAAGGIWWVIGTQLGPSPQFDLALVVSWLGAAAGLGVIVGAAFALWLEHGVATHARGLAQAVASHDIARLRGLPAASGWGELSVLTQHIQRLVQEYRNAERAAEELGLLRDQLAAVFESLERWNETERWKTLASETGAAAPVVEALNRGLRRADEVRDQNLEAARQIGKELERALVSARESSEQAEQGFVEATALLTSVRELQRLQVELKQALEGAGAEPAGATATARAAIEDLVAGSAEAVDHLARGLRRVEDVADQVSVLANRATLIALESTFGGRLVSDVERADQTRQLVADIRAAVDRSGRFSSELEAEVTGATQRMHEVRERVTRKLQGLPAETAPAPPSADVERLFERVGEMIQDATRKGERLSAAGERASRAAESLLRTLESEHREMEGLMVRLSPVSPEPVEVPPPARRTLPPAAATGLRLLREQDLLTDSPQTPRTPQAPQAGEEPR